MLSKLQSIGMNPVRNHPNNRNNLTVEARSQRLCYIKTNNSWGF